MKKARIAVLLAAALTLAACGSSDGQPTNAMYYWSTTFAIDSAKADFMRQHHVGKLYVRYFDVVVDDKGEVMPNATIRFAKGERAEQSFRASGGESSLEVVPVIFIMNDVMRRSTDGLAGRLLKRVLQMSETHGIANVSELQIDCDWSVKTRRQFFAFMKELHRLAHDQGLRLSATIRLHQLAQKPPTCDGGVLMMYNTGDFSDFSDEHPILDMQVAAPYLRYLKNYSLPLATAYPVFGYEVVFRENHTYVGLQHFDGELPIVAGDTIVRREADLGQVVQARRAIDKVRPDANREVILFDMSNQNITRFKHNEYEEIFGH